MAAMLFYETPVALNRERHRHLKLAPATGKFNFAQRTNSVLLAATELADAALSYPVVFVGNAGGPYALAAIVGLSDGQNLFLDADGSWAPDAYIPAFVRRYPFVLAEDGNAGDDLTVCVDEAFPGLNGTDGEPLFDADGQSSPMLNGVIDFLRLFHTEMRNTHEFAKQLGELDLLTPKVIEVERGGQKQAVDGIYIVDEAKLRALPDDVLARLVRNGSMQLIDAHLLSLKRVAGLAARLDRRAGATTPA